MSVVLVADTLSHPPSSSITCGGEQHTTQLSALATFHTGCWSGAGGSGFLSPDHYTPAPAHNSYVPDCASWWGGEREREWGRERERRRGEGEGEGEGRGRGERERARGRSEVPDRGEKRGRNKKRNSP